MPEENKPEQKKEEAKGLDIVESNVVLLKAELDAKTKLVGDLTKALDEMTKKYDQAKSFIESDTRSKLVASIKPRTQVSGDILARLSIDELKHMKDTLDSAMIPAFQSGTPLPNKEKDAYTELYSMNDKFMEKLRGGAP